MTTQTVYLGGDHLGRELKEELKIFFKDKGIDFVDLGVFKGDNIEYQSVAREVAEKVQEAEKPALGLLIFGKMS